MTPSQFALAFIIAALIFGLTTYFTHPCDNPHKDLCHGFNFAKDNGLKTAADCKLAGKPYFDTEPTNDFKRGCKAYFDK